MIEMIRMPLRLGPSSKMSIALRDVRPPTAEAARRLAVLASECETPAHASVGYAQSDGLPGKLYPHGVLRTVKAQNLCARVVHTTDTDTSGQQRTDFAKLVAALEEGKLVRSGPVPRPSFPPSQYSMDADASFWVTLLSEVHILPSADRRCEPVCFMFV